MIEKNHSFCLLFTVRFYHLLKHFLFQGCKKSQYHDGFCKSNIWWFWWNRESGSKNNEHDIPFMFSYSTLRKYFVPFFFFFLFFWSCLWGTVVQTKAFQISSCIQWSLCRSFPTWSLQWLYNGNAKLGSCWNIWELSNDLGLWISILFHLKLYLLKGLETWLNRTETVYPKQNRRDGCLFSLLRLFCVFCVSTISS